MTATMERAELVERYLLQQAELYGDDFYVTATNDLQMVDSSDSIAVAPKLAKFTFEELSQKVAVCKKCALGESRTQAIFGSGNPDARLLCVGEAPDYEDDKSGQPFSGAAGELLDKILVAIGFVRKEIYLTHAIKCRPGGSHAPNDKEMTSCLPYLEQQIELIQPKLILALGSFAAQALLGKCQSIESYRNAPHTFGKGIQVVVTYHPADMLRNNSLKRPAWQDVQRLRQLYDKVVGDKAV